MEALGVGIGLKTVCIVGGIDMFQQVPPFYYYGRAQILIVVRTKYA